MIFYFAFSQRMPGSGEQDPELLYSCILFYMSYKLKKKQYSSIQEGLWVSEKMETKFFASLSCELISLLSQMLLEFRKTQFGSSSDGAFEYDDVDLRAHSVVDFVRVF